MAGGQSKEALHELEAAALRVLTSDFADHATYAVNAYNLLADVVSHYARHPASVPEDQVSIRIASRMANDLHCASEIGFRGYGPQACGLVAAMFELAFTWVKVLGQGAAAANAWLTHADLRNTPVRAKEGLEYFVGLAIDELGSKPKPLRRKLIESCVETEYKVYTELCAFKHGNPRSILPIESPGNQFTAPIGPDAGLWGQMSLCFAIEHGGRLAELAVQYWTSKRLMKPDEIPFREALRRLSGARERLTERSKARWRTTAPG